MTSRIPNRLCLGIAVAFLPAAILDGFGPSAIIAHLLTGFAILLVGLLPGIGIGAGAIKLVAAMSVWFGPHEALFMFVSIAFLAVALSCCLPVLAGRKAVERPVLPFAVVAFAIVLPFSPLWQALGGFA